MFAMICTDNLRYKKTKYYDSEYVIKGTLHINEHAYAFSHYDGAFEVLGIRWLSNYTKGRYSKDTGLEFSFGADTEEGRLLQEHKDEAIECILQTVHAYKLTNIDAWVEYFNFAVSCTGTYQYSVTRCQAFPDERFRCTIKTPSPDCVLTYSFNFDEEEFPRLETPYFPGVELLETDIDKEFIMSPGKWLYGILNITCGPDDENPLPLCNDHARIADLKIALDCEVKLIWDSMVLSVLLMKPETKNGKATVSSVISCYNDIDRWYYDFKKHPTAKEWIRKFDKAFPEYKDISATKKIDFILWAGGEARIKTKRELACGSKDCAAAENEQN